MGLNDALAGWAVRATQVLVVEVPGEWLIRVELEQQMLRRGWRPAWTPADADVLAVCGAPGPELADNVTRLWEQLPGPRVRVDIDSPTHVSSALKEALTVLLNTPHQRADALDRRQRPQIGGNQGGMNHQGVDHHGPEDADHGMKAHSGHHGRDDHQDRPRPEAHQHQAPHGHGDMDHENHGNSGGHERHHGRADHGGHGNHLTGNHSDHAPSGGLDDHGVHGQHHAHHGGTSSEGHEDQHSQDDHRGEESHGGMDHSQHGGHGGMDMAPEGIPLAEGGEDRDGLGLDVLHLPLGPVLPYWPAGLVLRCSLQGDVVVEAAVSVVDGGHGRASRAGERCPGPGLSAAVRCDNVIALLALAGTQDTAARARTARDALLAGDERAARAAVERVHRAVHRSWLLHWSLRGVLPLTEADLEHHGLPAWCLGDVHDRLLWLVGRIRAEVVDEEPAAHAEAAVPVAVLGHLVTGLELAAVRLAVASLALDPLPAVQEVTHG